MSGLLPPLTDLVQLPPEPVRRLTVAEYHKMIKEGILYEDEPFELLEGWLVPKMTRNAPHDLAVGLAEDAIGPRLPPEWIRQSQSAVTTEDSEPEPDVAVVRGPRRRYGKQHPGPLEMGLVIEVSESSLNRDRTVKHRIYARSRVPVYWIVNLIDMHIEVYTDPTGPDAEPRYRQRQDYGPDDSIPLVLDGKEIDRIPVRDLLP
jgi:Uma2 family endonuclease